jgi:alkylhydroperoxidase family enzyme
MGSRIHTDDVDAALGPLDQATLPAATVMALRLVDLLTSEEPIVSPEFHAELASQFDDRQILELGAALAVASGWQRFIEAFGIRPDQWSPDEPQ